MIIGADGPLGRRVLERLRLDPEVQRIVAVGRGDLPRSWSEADGRREQSGPEILRAGFDLDDPRLWALLGDVTDVVHLGARHGLELEGSGGAEVDVEATARFLDAVAGNGTVRTLIVLSSALVYGARRGNPVPMNESAPVRPDPNIRAAVDRSDLERLCVSWSDDREVRCVSLRTAVIVGPENGRWLARSPWAGSGIRLAGATPLIQFVHMDDVADAVLCVFHAEVDGPVNVAPDGWMTLDEVATLKGPTLHFPVVRGQAERLARLGVRVGVAPGDPSTIGALDGPWVVSNDRLRSLGWVPGHTNEEAYVDADRGGVWARLTPRHRQQIALGAGGLLLVLAAAVTALVLRRRVRAALPE